ncbi:MAG: FliI/YscN family ATPase [Planctomycetota bacterium]|jgi:flagellum-specific ATP synthase
MITAEDPKTLFQNKINELPGILSASVSGKVERVVGLTVECSGMPVPVGAFCRIRAKLSRNAVDAEVVGFRPGKTLMMPLGEMGGIGPGDRVECVTAQQSVAVGPTLLGRILDGRGMPMDGKGPVNTTETRKIFSDPPDPVSRPRITEKLATGTRSIDSFITVGRGQRIGIFSGTGVGKSVLLGNIAKYTNADISVIALVGERGREVREFIENNLGEEGLARSVVIVSTSEKPAPVRVKAPFVATAIAEYFRDQGLDVALMMDSVTRMAMAQRDIGGSIGEVPATKGYTPSVFALIPKLMERAGKSEKGSITGFYTVLVEGDDMNEPVSDTVRGVLDGHMVLSRKLAQKNHFPAVDVLQSISRVMVDISDDDHLLAAGELRSALASYMEAEDLINIGAYVEGANPEVDAAQKIMPALNDFLRQGIREASDLPATLVKLKELRDLYQRSKGK